MAIGSSTIDEIKSKVIVDVIGREVPLWNKAVVTGVFVHFTMKTPSFMVNEQKADF